MASFSTNEKAIGNYHYLAKLHDDEYKEEWKNPGGKSTKYIAYMKNEGSRPSLKIVRWQTICRQDINGSATYDHYIDAWNFFPDFKHRKEESIFELRTQYFNFLLKQIPKIKVMEEI